MNSLEDNALYQIKQLAGNDPSSMREMAGRVFDKKLKSFLSLNSKQQVLQNCQEFLITKTVEYMNAITTLETSQLKILNSLNEALNEKNSVISQSKTLILELKQIKKEQEGKIEGLEKSVVKMTEQLEEAKIKLSNQVETHYKSKIEFEKRSNLIREEFYSTRAELQSEIKELSKALEDKIAEGKSVDMTFKIEINNIKATKDREILELTRKSKQANSEFERRREELAKENKYLQNLVEVKIDEIAEMRRREKPVVVANKRVFMGLCQVLEIVVEPTKLEKVEKVEKQEKPETPRGLSKNKILERIKKSGDQKLEKVERVMEKMEKAEVERVERVERGDMMTNEWFTSQQSTTKSKRVSVGTQTAYADPFDNREVTELQLQLRCYLEEQYENKYDETVRQLNRKYQQEYKNSMGIAKTMVLELASLTKEQIDLVSLRVKEMESMYCDRPSREEDLVYIQSLLAENGSLTGLCEEANIKTDSAYLALKEYHTKLESYRRLVPMTIVGREEPPHIIHQQHRQEKLEHSKDMKATRSQFVKNFNSIASWGLSEPTTSRKTNRHGRWEDETFEATKDVLVSEFETADPLSPIKRKSAHSKSNNILSIRKKSGIN